MIVIISGVCTKVRDILLPLTSVHGSPCSPCSPWWISISALHCCTSRVICRSVSESGGTQITQLVPGAHFLVARDVLARMWVYNRINIFYLLFVFVFVCLVVGCNPVRIPRQIN